MIQFNVFPGGKKRIVTFSFDDGYINDERLISIFNKYGVKGTFHLNGINYRDADENTLDEIRRRYQGHEISCHTVHHGWLNKMPYESVINEAVGDRTILEKITGYPVKGMSYPSGAYNDHVISLLSACGIVYNRIAESSFEFELPDDFMKWQPTCHYSEIDRVVDPFLSQLDSEWCRPLLYIWGHSHEIRNEDDWAFVEALIKKISGNDKIWYATNMDIYNYISCQKQLQLSADESIIYNPTASDIWVERDKWEIIKIPAGQTVKL